MTETFDEVTGSVLCPICLHEFDWRSAELLERVTSEEGVSSFQPLDLSQVRDRLLFRDRMINAYRACPNPYRRAPHYLPVRYGDHGDPLVIGVVGESLAGKSHLLAAMIGLVALRGGLDRLGLLVAPVDPALHQQYVTSHVNRVFQEHRVLEPNRARQPVEFADALLFTNTRTRRNHVVAFFDVAGEDLTRIDEGTRFISAVGALLFVVDPTRVPDLLHRHGSALTDLTFEAVLNRLASVRNSELAPSFLRIPAAIVIGKSDLLPHKPPAYDWLTREDNAEMVDATLIREESSDAYAFLYAHDAIGWLRPANACLDATLHFASATGTSPENGRFLYGVRPLRVLQPLIALLAMAGVLDSNVVRGRVGW